jgi:hypothetical protein
MQLIDDEGIKVLGTVGEIFIGGLVLPEQEEKTDKTETKTRLGEGEMNEDGNSLEVYDTAA